MSQDAARALQLENEFLTGVEARFEQAKGKQLRGTIWRTSRHEETDTVRALMASRGLYDRELLKKMPCNRRVCVYGYERTWWLGRRKTGVAVAASLSPLGDFVSSTAAPGSPIGVADLMAHVRKLITDPKVPHVVGLCSTTGFTAEARNAKLDFPNVVLVLVEPKAQGGWRVLGGEANLPAEVLALFDPENTGDKLRRVREEIDRRSPELLTGGLSSASLAERLDLPPTLVAQALEQVARADGELKVTWRGSDALIFRGAPTARRERTSMNVVDRIRQFFAGHPDEAAKINLLAERRAALAQRRDRLYEDIGKLEAREAELLDQGRQSKSQVVRRRLAAQLAQMRKDIARENATAGMLNQQINILSTDIHNLTLIQQGQLASLPTTEELTENAVRAEEMLETLKADADLVRTLESDMGAMTADEEELAILAEFDDKASEPPSATGRLRASAAEPDPFIEEPPVRKKHSAGPEAT